MIEDLWFIGPFLFAGVLAVGMGLVISHQTTLSGREVDRLLAERHAKRHRPAGMTMPTTRRPGKSAPRRNTVDHG